MHSYFSCTFKIRFLSIAWKCSTSSYRDADKSLARPGRKQVNVSVRMAWISLGTLPFRGGKKLDDSPRLHVVEIARGPCHTSRDCFLPGRAKDLSVPRYFPAKWHSADNRNLCQCMRPHGSRGHQRKLVAFQLCVRFCMYAIYVTSVQ